MRRGLIFVLVVVASLVVGIGCLDLLGVSVNIGSPQERITRVKGSGSMIPTINKTSLLNVSKVGLGESIKLGQIYIYKKRGGVGTIVHRVICQDPNGDYVFMGDNNEYYDAPVSREQILEKVNEII